MSQVELRRRERTAPMAWASGFWPATGTSTNRARSQLTSAFDFVRHSKVSLVAREETSHLVGLLKVTANSGKVPGHIQTEPGSKLSDTRVWMQISVKNLGEDQN
jgi:hypothetical protein